MLTLIFAVAWTLLAPMLGAATQDVLWTPAEQLDGPMSEQPDDSACADFGDHVWSSGSGIHQHGVLAELLSEAEVEIDDSFEFATMGVIRPSADEPFTSGDNALPSYLLTSDRWGRAPPSCRGPPTA